MTLLRMSPCLSLLVFFVEEELPAPVRWILRMFHRWRCSSPTSASTDCHSSCQKSSTFTHLRPSRLSLPQKAAVTSLGVLRRGRSQSDVRARIDAYLRRGRRGRELTSARTRVRVCDALPGGSRSCRVCSHLSG